MNVEVGNFVRSFDFAWSDFGRDLEGERACYIEGFVEGVTDPKTDEHFRDCARYRICVSRRVLGGRSQPDAQSNYVFPPVNGTPMLGGGHCNMVEKLYD